MVISVCVILSACTDADKVETNNGTYNFETDMQYYYHRQSENLPLTVSPDGYYYVGDGGIIIYVDKATLKATPLCNKVNCKHDNKDTCSAYQINTGILSYFGDESFSTILQYYKGYIYTVDFEYDTEKLSYFPYLKRINLDGTNTKKMTGRLDTGSSFEDWFIHRGYMYFVTDKAIYRVDMEHLKKEKETVFELKEYKKNVNNISLVSAYDDFLYFMYLGDKEIEYYNVNVNNLKKTKLMFEGESEGAHSFLDGKVVFKKADKKAGINHYFGDFYLKNPQNFTNQKIGYSFNTDGKYIYFDNLNNLEISNGDKQTVWVYDKEMNEVDSFTLPYCVLAGQDPDYFIFSMLDENGENCLYAIDKAQIGTIDGKTPEMTKLYTLPQAENNIITWD